MLAVLFRARAAFPCAAPAGFFACQAQLPGKVAALRHKACRRPACLRAIAGELNAGRHADKLRLGRHG